MQETQVRFLGLKDPLEKSDNSLQFACLENPMNRGGNPWDHVKLDMTEQLTLIYILWLV